MKQVALALGMAFLTVGTVPASAQSTYDRIKVDAGETLFFSECRRCHAPDPTDPSYGPQLDNIVGGRPGPFLDMNIRQP